MTSWEYLRISVYHKEDGNLDFVAKKDKTMPSSIATHDGMEAHFNVSQSEWEAYLQKLQAQGWQLDKVEKRGDGQSESFYFKKSRP